MPEGKNRRLESDIEEGKSREKEASESSFATINEATRPQLQEDMLDSATSSEDEVEE